jgi:apolipoprotein N-acyltransferase
MLLSIQHNKIAKKIFTYICNKYCYSFVAGILLPFAFAPYGIWGVAIISLFALITIWKECKPKQALMSGFIFGAAYFGFGITWFINCVADYCQVSKFAASLLYIIVVAIIASYIALAGALFRWVYATYTVRALVLAFPAIWVTCEWLRSWLFTGFPWLVLGYSQVDAPLKSFAPIIGVFGISWLLLISVSLLYISVHKNTYKFKIRLFSIISLISLWALALILHNISWTKFDSVPHKVSLIQTNLDPKNKPKLTFEEHARIYSPLTIANLDSELIIWPEHSLPYFLPYSASYLGEIAKLGKQHNLTILLGALDSPPELFKKDMLYFYNSVVAVGAGSGNYYKQKLVPFAEYLPFEKFVGKILKKFDIKYRVAVKGNRKEPQNLVVPNSNLLPVICYELTYAEHLRARLKDSQANVIVNLSEDGWFGDSNVLALNIDVARMRALETGRYILRSATRGITAIIDPKGNVIAASRPFVTDAVRGEYYNALNQTPWTTLGMPYLLLLMLICVVLAFNWRALPMRLLK